MMGYLVFNPLSAEPKNSRHVGMMQVEINDMSHEPDVSRAGPRAVEAIEFNGVRYEQELNSYNHGGNQPGGYLSAVDIKSGQRLWMIKVYDVNNDDGSKVDVIGLYFSRMSLLAEHNALEIEDEAGRHFQVDLNNRTVKQTFNPRCETFPEPATPPPMPPVNP